MKKYPMQHLKTNDAKMTPMGKAGGNVWNCFLSNGSTPTCSVSL